MRYKSFKPRVIFSMSLVILFCFYLTNVKSQINPKEIIEKSIEAVGGEDTLIKVKDQVAIASVKIYTPEGEISGERTSYLKFEPLKFRMEQTVNGMTIIIGYDGQTVWLEQMGNAMIAPPPITNSVKGTTTRQNLLLKYLKGECNIEYLGEGRANQQPCYQIKLFDKEGNETVYYIDAKTYFPLKMEFEGSDEEGNTVKKEVVSSDFRLVGNLMIPYKTVAFANGQKQIEVINKEIKINQDLENNLFSMPKN